MTPPIPINRTAVYQYCIGEKWIVAYHWKEGGVQINRVLCRSPLQGGAPFWSDGGVCDPLILWTSQAEAREALRQYYEWEEQSLSVKNDENLNKVI